MFQGWNDNFCSLIVDAISERLRIDGFRMSDDPEADKDAWEIWQRSYLDADSNSSHIDALALGHSYVTVWGDSDDQPVITPESAMEMVVQYEPGSRRKLMAAMKKYRDDWGAEYVTLWTPEYVFTTTRGGDNRSWKTPEQDDNPLKVVPVVPIVNRTRLRMEPYSELKPIIPLNDVVTKIAADAIVASEFAAVPMRWAAGMEIERDTSGQPIAPIKMAINRILQAEDPETKFGEFAAADLSNYVDLINCFVQHMSTISRVPAHYFLIGGQMPSGDALATAEAGLVAKAKERMLHFGESWEEAMRLAFRVKGDPRMDAWNAETIWADPEFRSEAMRVDALAKLSQSLDVPKKQLWSDAGYTPSQIERFKEMNEEQFQEELERAKKMAPITGAIGGSAPAGNGKRAGESDADKRPRSNYGNENRAAAGK